MEWLASLLNSIAPEQLEALLTAVVAILAVPLTDLVKKFSTKLDSLSPWLKQLLVIPIAMILTWATTLFNLALPETVAGLDPTVMNAILSSIGAWAIKAGQQATKAKELTS